MYALRQANANDYTKKHSEHVRRIYDPIKTICF